MDGPSVVTTVITQDELPHLELNKEHEQSFSRIKHSWLQSVMHVKRIG